MKKVAAALAGLLAASALAAIEANTATQAELESISGVGTSISTDIIDERKKGDFKDWNDLARRVRGVGDRSAVRFSAGGMTVNGKSYGDARHVEPAKTPVPSTAGSAPAK